MFKKLISHIEKHRTLQEAGELHLVYTARWVNVSIKVQFQILMFKRHFDSLDFWGVISLERFLSAASGTLWPGPHRQIYMLEGRKV